MSLNVQLLKSSFEIAKPMGNEIVDMFYTYLLSENPELVDVFQHANMDVQKDALLRSLAYIVDHVEDADKLLHFLAALGKQHAMLNIGETAFDKVGEALIKSLSYHLGPDWTPEVEATWLAAYGVISSTMLASIGEVATPA